MRKQFFYLLGALAISSSIFVGCGNKESALPETSITEESTTGENTTLENEAETEETPETSEEEKPGAENVPTEEENSKPEISTEQKTEGKVENTNKDNTTSKPQTKPNTTTKPNTETKPNTTTKPEAPKPTPEVKPETKPEPKPEVKPETVTLSASDVYSKMLDGIEIPKQNPLDDTLLKDWYGIDASILESYKVTMPLMSMHVNEYAVFKVKDSKDVQTVLDGITKRTDGMFLYPSLQEAFDARQVVTKGNYILFVIDGESVDKVVSNFNNLMK